MASGAGKRRTASMPAEDSAFDEECRWTRTGPATPSRRKRRGKSITPPPKMSFTTTRSPESSKGTASRSQAEGRVPERRIVLLGKTGLGKSASANTILGKRVFTQEFSFDSVTQTCAKQCAEVAGRHITVIDTPGLFDTGRSIEQLKSELEKCVQLSLPGPHAFLLVIRLDVRFTEEERNTVNWIQENFGERALKYTIVVLTHGDVLEGNPVKGFLQKSDFLSSLIERFGGRYHVFNNRKKRDRTQVRQLLWKIDAMVEENGGECYTSKMYQDAQSKVREKEEREREEEERRRLEHESRITDERNKRKAAEKEAEVERRSKEEAERKVQEERKKAELERMEEEANKRKADAERKKKEEAQKRTEKEIKKKREAEDEAEEERRGKEEAEKKAEESEREAEEERRKRREAELEVEEERRKRGEAEKRAQVERQKRERAEREQREKDEEVPSSMQRMAILGGFVGATVATGGVAAAGVVGGAAAAAVGGASALGGAALAMLSRLHGRGSKQVDIQETGDSEEESEVDDG